MQYRVQFTGWPGPNPLDFLCGRPFRLHSRYTFPAETIGAKAIFEDKLRMQAGRWKNVEELYQAAIALSAEARRLPGTSLPRRFRSACRSAIVARVRFPRARREELVRPGVRSGRGKPRRLVNAMLWLIQGLAEQIHACRRSGVGGGPRRRRPASIRAWISLPGLSIETHLPLAERDIL
jgi:hypothetical protein